MLFENTLKQTQEKCVVGAKRKTVLFLAAPTSHSHLPSSSLCFAVSHFSPTNHHPSPTFYMHKLTDSTDIWQIIR